MRKLSLHNSRRILCFLMTVVLGLGLMTGCSLADKEASSETDQINMKADHLVGFLITKELLEKKIYAEKVQVTDENANNYYRYEFDIPNSIGMYTWVETDADGQKTRYSYEKDGVEYVADYLANYGYNQNDGSKNTKISGTIYIDSDYLKKIETMNMYIYNVYQETDGDVYLETENDWIEFNSDTMTPQSSMANESSDITVNGETVKEEMEVNANFDFAIPSDKTEILFFDENLEVAKRLTYDNAEIPETIPVNKSYKQIVVKSMKDKEIRSRKLVTITDDENEYYENVQVQSDIEGVLGTKQVEFIVK